MAVPRKVRTIDRNRNCGLVSLNQSINFFINPPILTEPGLIIYLSLFIHVCLYIKFQALLSSCRKFTATTGKLHTVMRDRGDNKYFLIRLPFARYGRFIFTSGKTCRNIHACGTGKVLEQNNCFKVKKAIFMRKGQESNLPPQ